MSTPRFSVIIPTRERAETVAFALRTATDQDFDNFEIIVHDNCSSPATREAVMENKSDKVRYERSDEPLAMTDAWERALSFAKGEYIIIIGDDDGLVPHALSTLDPFLKERSAKLVRWARASYHWPNHPYPAKRNSLKIPLSNKGYVMPSRHVIRKVANMDMLFQTLPMLYNSVAHRDLIAQVRSQCGRVFSSLSPDVGSGFALAFIAGHYLSIDSPFSIGGISGKSNGLGYTPDTNPENPGPKVFNDFKTLNSKSGRDIHHRMPHLYLLPALIGDSFCTVKDKLFPDDSYLDVRRRDLIKNCFKELKFLPREAGPEAVAALKANISDDPTLVTWFDQTIASKPLPEPEAPFSTRSPRGYVERERILALDPTDFGVTDVYGASQLCGKILNYDRGGFRCEIQSFHASPVRQLRSIARTLVRRGSPDLADCD